MEVLRYGSYNYLVLFNLQRRFNILFSQGAARASHIHDAARFYFLPCHDGFRAGTGAAPESDKVSPRDIGPGVPRPVGDVLLARGECHFTGLIRGGRRFGKVFGFCLSRIQRSQKRASLPPLNWQARSARRTASAPSRNSALGFVARNQAKSFR